jgi:hypothetical protein
VPSPENNEISVYFGELNPETIVKSVARIKGAFPSLPPEFYQLFIERLKEKGFTDQRLKEAVNNVIDNCIYPTPTLANFLSFDKRVKLFDYRQVCSMVVKQEVKFDDFSTFKISGNTFYVRNSDKIKYNMPDEIRS